ncbi:XdhC family protein [Polynucleobacter sp. AP-Capit-er-40B-B4]|jgi:xanthine dehydrogenase accessory factor|uniref:XdhC family protein n=1 Tax=Polynucleobacter sp. AP-Capit-er-40B-B4 TaxID=2576927 RepID=UPI001C0B3405|nr:XdhC family protein [Polynucleobacter sp. AP-Capit-er-40B-B4]MBU3582182.1 XdhC family protein [Polynucleobacter sp. AP-Capit-er-40B-B4]
MNSTDLSVLKSAVEWLQSGQSVAIATVVQTWGSAPRPVGSWLAIRADGQVAGSVSGGCVEDDLIRRVQTEILTRNTPEMVVYGVTQQEAARFGLPCGGTLRLLVEPKPELAVLEKLLENISTHQITRRSVSLSTGKSTLTMGDRSDEFVCTEQEMQTTYGPRWRMVIIGAGQLSLYTADFALASDFEVIVIDPREEYAEGLNRTDITFSKGMPDDVLLEIGVDSHTAVVALTHDPKLDDMALMEALKSPAFYVGALGSRKNTQKRKERLLEFDVSQEQVEKLHGPVGLYIGALTPPEIAVSILAEVIAVKYGISVPKKV